MTFFSNVRIMDLWRNLPWNENANNFFLNIFEVNNKYIRTGLNMVLLMVRREISSTLGLKTASWALFPERERRWSQGESWVWLNRNDSFVENARPKVNPSPLWIFVSEHGSNTGFVSHASAWTIIRTITTILVTTIVFPMVGKTALCFC